MQSLSSLRLRNTKSTILETFTARLNDIFMTHLHLTGGSVFLQNGVRMTAMMRALMTSQSLRYSTTVRHQCRRLWER